ncbi:MAG: hypothetical protein EXR93_00485 [Gemmatimonadetes bacterium]|nr:hypothetical protein [Gemmatimonadota bacterium]
MYILGLSAFYHDSAACLLKDGEIVAAAQEERFTRVKGDAAFPARAVEYCLGTAGISGRDLALVAFYDKPLLKFERILETWLSVAPRGFGSFLRAGPAWLREKLDTERRIRRGLDYKGQLLFAEHHESHAASAFFPSPFPEAAILTMDGVGEWATATIGVGRGNDVELTSELRWPDSLGLLYSAFTHYTGFSVNSDEYRVMGLAPYGRPTYAQRILDDVVDLKEDGSFRLNQAYFNYLAGLTMTSDAFHAAFGGPPRVPESPITQREKDLARSVQDVCEEIVLRMARTAHRDTGMENLCLAGGVALNGVANGKVVREGPFRRVWVQPAAGDAGGALGAALLAWHRHLKNERAAPVDDAMHGSFLGPSFPDDDIEQRLTRLGARFRRLGDRDLLPEVAGLLAQGKVIGWFSGRMEFGPRALGARSILADPRASAMRDTVNVKVKLREEFRPFAPSVVRERVTDYFALDGDAPYMTLVVRVKPDRGIPAVTHVDGSARVQTVDRERNPRFHSLLIEFERQTGCAVLLNTSFNLRGEPIVCTPEDAYGSFMRTNLDYLVLGPVLLDKGAQSSAPVAVDGGGLPHGAWRTLRRAWGLLGRALSRVTSPVLLGAAYYLLLAPTGAFLRLAGRDPLRPVPHPLTPSPIRERGNVGKTSGGTYWRTRNGPGESRSDLMRQF